MPIITEKSEKVGVVGLGIIGSRVAETLGNSGYHVYVWNRTPKPVPNFLSSPAEIAQLVDYLQIFVSNGEALLEVVNDLLPKIEKNHVVINNSTVEPEATRKAAQLVTEAGGAYLDAPFTGSKEASEKGTLVYYVGGDPRTLERVQPLLQASGKEVLYVGDIGDAAVIKIATNMISATAVQVLTEAYALTVASGLDPERLSDALEHNACGSALTSMKLPTIIEEDYEPHFALKNMFKDAQFALNLANKHGIDLPALSTTASLMFKTMQKGFGEDDYSVLARNYQDQMSGWASQAGQEANQRRAKKATEKKAPARKKSAKKATKKAPAKDEAK